jgi:hypothetical protein
MEIGEASLAWQQQHQICPRPPPPPPLQQPTNECNQFVDISASGKGEIPVPSWVVVVLMHRPHFSVKFCESNDGLNRFEVGCAAHFRFRSKQGKM